MDLIDRQAAIYALKPCAGVGNRALDKLRALPSAEPKKGTWIPCSERLPEDGKWCLFTDGKNMSVERYKLDAIDHFFPNGRWFEFDDAVAWMPLPKPYEERREA